ncbi:MAG: hypothetical protein HC880_07245 [Bacteroidia bacterium]|nr:hypothetical protein [Bacteroidia bacterium]
MNTTYLNTKQINYQPGEKVLGCWRAELTAEGNFGLDFPMAKMKGGFFKGELTLSDQCLYFALQNISIHLWATTRPWRGL